MPVKSKNPAKNAPVTFLKSPDPEPPPEQLPVPLEEGPSDIIGDIDSSDSALAQLILKHAIDTRFEDVAPGNYVLSLGAETYCTLPPPLSVVVLHLKKGFLQETEPGEAPIKAWSREELEEAGGTLEAGNPDLLLFKPFAEIKLLIADIARTGHAEIEFVDVLGKKYAPAIYQAKRSAYNATAKELITWVRIQYSRGNKSARMLDYPYVMNVAKRPWKGTTFLAPTMKRGATPHAATEIKAFGEIASNL